ncbi:hypothetical protein DFQ27_005474 [Actinomortierella ambigua]|uniref:RRM domain-containing protein n=1 Tax=Actinomortierella ambigua TaxID=1343610 RepID=A0A9P6U1T1_9FUNG|nr:hypothetical protein DFQ27_005474 [Actinomortierella ambigua]
MSTSNKVYVGNLSWRTTDDTLRAAFERSGAITDVAIMRDRDTNRSRGFGFVTFSDQAGAEKAIAQFNDVEFDGRVLQVNLAVQRSGHGGSN